MRCSLTVPLSSLVSVGHNILLTEPRISKPEPDLVTYHHPVGVRRLPWHRLELDGRLADSLLSTEGLERQRNSGHRKGRMEAVGMGNGGSQGSQASTIQGVRNRHPETPVNQIQGEPDPTVSGGPEPRDACKK